MVPEAIMILEEMPLTANGKVDRKRLPEVKDGGRQSEQEYAGARTPVEEIVIGIFEEVLKAEGVGRKDDFFEIGGHSLLAMQVVSRVRNVFRVEIGVVSVFEDPTVEGLAQRIEEALKFGEKQEAPPLVRAPRNERPPLSFSQQRLWFLDQLMQYHPVCNVPGAVRLQGRLDFKVLERVINEIVRRHEILRTRIDVEEGEPVQVITEWEPRRLEVKDLRSLPPEEREEEVRKITIEEAVAGFDLGRGPLLRVKLLKLEEEDHALLFTLHYIVSDAWSVEKLVRELGKLYEAVSKGQESPLQELEIQYADYAYWQRQYLTGAVLEKSLAYWKKQFVETLPSLDLPVDHPRRAVFSHQGKSKSFLLPIKLDESLREMSRREGVTLSMVLLAAFKTLLYRYTAQEDIIISVAIANRIRTEIAPLIGPFVNMLPLRTNLGGNPKFKELLRQVKEVMLGGYLYQDLPFEKLIEGIKSENATKEMFLHNIAFGLQNPRWEDLSINGIQIKPLVSEQEITRFDLGLWITAGRKETQVCWTYRKDLFEEGTVIRIHNHFEMLLFNIIDRPDARLLSIEILSRAKTRLSHKEQSELEESNRRKLMLVKRKGINLPTEPA